MNLLNKMLVAPVVTIVLMIILGAVGYWSMSSQQKALEELYNGRFSHTAVATDISDDVLRACLLYTSPSPRDRQKSRMPSSA